MADYSKINGIESGDIAKVFAVETSNIEKVSGFTKPSEGPETASRWIVGASSGKIYSTTVSNGSSGWAELTDIGTMTIKDVAVGQDNAGNKRWILQGGSNTNEIWYANASLDVSDANNWSSVDLSGNYKAVDKGPALAWGNNVWVAGGNKVHDGDSYRTLWRSTDGGASWVSVDEGNTINDSTISVAYKGSGSVWLMGHQSHIWKSTDDGANWTDTATLKGTKDIFALAYNGNGRWVALLANDNVFYSDDDGDNWTEASGGAWSGTWNTTGLVYAKGNINKWIACGASGRLSYSSDGASWTGIWEGDDSDWSSDHINGIASDNSTVIIVGNNGKIAYSTNGTSFTVLSPAVSGVTTSYKSIASDVIGGGLR